MGMVLAVLAGGPAQRGWQLIGSMGSTGVCRPHWGVGFAHSAINNCVTPNPKYTTKSESYCRSVSFLTPSSWGLRW